MISTPVHPAPIVLASASPVRAAMLQAAGLDIATIVSEVDEEAVKRKMAISQAPAPSLAERLATLKAEDVARHHPDAAVIGADQVLACEGRLIDKAPDRDAARRTLQSLRGRTHDLYSAAAVVHGDRLLWCGHTRARVHMRDFSERFLDDYLEHAGAAILGSVGAYHFEGRGAQLFERVEGDPYAVMGLPLLELLGVLRHHGWIAA